MRKLAGNVWSLEAAPDPRTFLLNTSGKWHLTDTGHPWQSRQLLREVQCGTQHMYAVLLTHYDLDRISGSTLLRRVLQAPVGVHKADRPIFFGARKDPWIWLLEGARASRDSLCMVELRSFCEGLGMPEVIKVSETGLISQMI